MRGARPTVTTIWGSPQRRQSRIEAPVCGRPPIPYMSTATAQNDNQNPGASTAAGSRIEDRHQSETQGGAPGQPSADAERAEQHDGHDERSPGRERESGEGRVAGGHRHPGERAEAHRRDAGDEPRSRDPSGEEPEAGGKSDVKARDREKMGGAGPAEGLPLAVVNAVAHSHDERFDQCSHRTDFRYFA